MTGIFGGSFDPVHNGHLAVAIGALLQHEADEVWFMVSPENPLKQGHLHASEADRLQMARLAVDSISEPELIGKIIVSDFEFSLPRPSYTIDTLRALSEAFAGKRFKWIVGSDNLVNFSQWRSPEEILESYGIIVYPRPGYPLSTDVPESVRILTNVPSFKESSTSIRSALRQGADAYSLPLPRGVRDYIAARENLYGVSI
ncbi:MAG: nicotinate (nicotinamide) nucleotide adenylyltransferase [Muribaculaceae bacterium]|nr:nicotinate (nicotinamide) nucleotide adenylyltransferase [Muribaculaceae bacterium]